MSPAYRWDSPQHGRRPRLARTVVVTLAAVLALALNAAGVRPAVVAIVLLEVVLIGMVLAELVRHLQKWRP